MSLAMKRLKNLGWLALVFMVAILLYPLSLNVAAVHSDLIAVDRQILDTKREISFLQAEIRTRASLQQLEEWNELLYGYAPPTAAQFVDGEAALAGLSSDMPEAKPVMVAVGEHPSGVIGGGTRSAAAFDPEPDFEKSEVEKPVLSIEKPKAQQSRTERLARMDEKLLSDDFMRDIAAKADGERNGR
ncbi:hypothetical protein [Sphingorhabdus sp.]|uniref:hypothetical protein n=1 Tax=Sphingorhabdus sp. TaxID=1902408 RepID=UPI0035930C4E